MGILFASVGSACGVYSAVLILFTGLIAYDVRVAIWISEAAQAEFSSTNEMDAPPPVKLAAQKTAIR
jgi:hypothetical protein